MLCYRDKTFCSQNCANTYCSRNMNDEVMVLAREWWGDKGEPPICFGDFRSDDCWFIEFKVLEVKK